MSKDYYNILGINKSASKDEVKRAFRKKAHEFHPDKGGDEQKFKEVNEAYQVLGDETKRKQYDQFGTTFDQAGGGAGGFSGQGGFHNVNFEDLGDLFGDMFGGFAGGGGEGRRMRKGDDILVDVDLTFKESVFGTEKEISVTKNNQCERCGGVGAEPGTNLKTCDDCSGQGYKTQVQRTMLGAVQTRVTCRTCSGQGEVPETKCSECGGDGTIYGERTLRVDVPAGVEDGMRIRVRGEGEAIGSGENGDLYIRIHVPKDPRFTREGFHIYSEEEIGFTQAALGDEIQTDTVNGKVKLKIPAGIQSGEKLRLKGLGVPNGNRKGDQYVVVKVKTPKKLSRNQKKVLEELNLREE